MQGVTDGGHRYTKQQFQTFVQWQETVAAIIRTEFGLTDAEVTISEVCDITGLLEYFYKHSYQREPIEVRQETVTVGSVSTTTLSLAYQGQKVVPVARSNDVSRITRLVGRMDEGGKEYASYAKTVDDGIRLLGTNLERFQSYLRDIIRTMKWFPHQLKRKCSIEKTLEGKRPG